MWSDNHSKTDFLNFSATAKSVAELVLNDRILPVSIGIYGGWGTGKSSMMCLLQHEITLRAQEKQAKGNGDDATRSVEFVEFNGWLYQGFDDAKSALLDVILRRLQKLSEADVNLTEQIADLFQRLDYLKLAGYGIKAAAYIGLGLAIPGAVGLASDAFLKLFHGSKKKEDLEEIEKGFKETATAASKIFKDSDKRSAPKQIEEFRNKFSDILEKLKVTLVVFIDDLDRCLPKVAIETLEAIRLLLFVPRTAFVIAADEPMIRYAVSEHFRGLPEDYVTNYLDKLIQIPVRVPPLGTQEVRAYMMMLFLDQNINDSKCVEKIRTLVCKALEGSWQDKGVDCDELIKQIDNCPSSIPSLLALSERLAPIMTEAEKIAGNPRLIKRFLNTVFLRLSLAKQQGITVDEAVLAKLLLFERCGGEDAYRILVREVTSSGDGSSKTLATMEEEAESKDGLKSIPPGVTKEFLTEWAKMAPKLGTADLRGAVHVSRDNLQLLADGAKLSQDGNNVLNELIRQKNTTNPQLVQRLKNLQPADQKIIRERIISGLKQIQSWTNRSEAFNAAILLAEANSDHAKHVSTFLGDLPQQSIKNWMVPILGQTEWGREVLSVLAPKGDTKFKRSVETITGAK